MDHRPLVTIIIPAYNEDTVITRSLDILYKYMKSIEERFRWELVIVNDGSSDETGALADSFAGARTNVFVHHHKENQNLGAALRNGFEKANGDYAVVLDIDLSYSPDHVEKMLDKIIETNADLVVASPYMKGGKSTKVPFVRLLLSKTVNKLMRFSSGIDVHTFTSMARAYRTEFLRSLNLKSSTYAINPEIIQKASILRAKIVEIPAHLDWSYQESEGKDRTSSIRIYKGVLLGLMSSFIFRPYGFFMVAGLTLLFISMYMIVWIFYHTMVAYPDVQVASGLLNDQFTEAVATVFRQRPHAFFVGGITLIVALQFLSIGFLSLQNKRYFDELFHLGTTLHKERNQNTTRN